MGNIIEVRDVVKEYRLGAIGGGTLRGDMQSFFARVRGKEDPNLKIGVDQSHLNERFRALDGVSFDVKKGDAVGLIGGNGAGKSTMLKLLSQITAPTAGEIMLEGRVASMLEVGTGFHPELTGRENVYLNGAILGMSKSEISKKFDEIVEFSEVSKFIDTPVKRYSSGMYVKLAFSVAAHLDSEIMIMDEVLAVGDAAFQQKCITKMCEEANSGGRTILYVSHNMNTVRQLCNRTVVLDKGKKIFDGDVEGGIEKYLDNQAYEQKLFNDYTNMPRLKHLEKQRDADLISSEILNKDSCVFENGEKIVFRLNWQQNKSLGDVFARIEIRYRDDSPVGASLCKEKLNKTDEKNHSNVLSFDVSSLAAGEYKAMIVLYELNSFGAKNDLDAAWPAFSFTKEVSDNNIVWNGRYWGYNRFPDIEVL